MAYDVIKPTGSAKASRPEAGGANTRSVPMLAIVKDNIDPIRAGRLQVYIADFGGLDSDDATAWTTVSYMSPFFGVTEATSAKTGYGEYTKNSSSYGMWTSPPDIGSTVVCIFINGDPNYGFYIGCVPAPETLYMVPAIAGSDNIISNETEASSYGGATRLPVTNINTNNKALSEGANFLKEARPVHSYAAAVLMQQGLIRDPIRGVIGSSSQRESPSRVGYGISTPGRPTVDGGFTDESITENLDNKTPEKLKVIARRGGHTFVMDDGDVLGRDQLVRLRTATGHQILMSDDGQCLFIIHANGQSWIELGKEGTIDMYASNSVNIRTQGDLNLHADNNININAIKTLNISAETINTSSDKETTVKVGTDFRQYVAGKYTVKVTGGMSMDSSGEASYSSSSVTYINGSKVNLNSGSTSLVPAEVKPIPIIKHTDTLYDSTKGFAAAPGKLSSIVSRAPAHAPWVSAGLGVDVKTELGAASSLPTTPSAAAVSANTAAASAGTIDPVSTAVASTVPSTDAVSESIDKNAAGTMVAQAATMAAKGPAAAAAAVGAGIVGTGATAVAAVGVCAASVKQLESAGIIKPGSADRVAALVAGGKHTIEQALPANLFTGKSGAESLNRLVANPQAQVNMQISNMQTAQSGLTAAGLMTGKESPTQIAGMVLAGATAGVAAVTKLVRTPGAAVVGSVLGSVSKAMASGNFAAGVASSITGGMSSIAGALGGAVNAAKGVVGSAFSAITAGWKALTPGVPQNLTAIAAANALPGAAAVGAGIVGLSSAVTAAATGLASGVNAIPGGARAVTSLINSAKGAVDSVPGVAAVTRLATGASTGNLVATAMAGLGVTGAAGKTAAALLNSAMSGQGGGGASPEKLAITAINTLPTRESMAAGLKAAIGAKTAAPNYTGNAATFGPTAGTAKVDEYNAKQASIVAKEDELFVAMKDVRDATEAYQVAKNSLPAGSSQIATAKTALETARAKVATIEASLRSLRT